MIAALLLAAAAPQTAVDAERAFAADAQTLGQWSAFRKWAAPDAIMFTPRPTNTHEFLKGLPDPRLTYQWWPAKVYVSCDGKAAVTTGPAIRGTYRGYFTTIWVRQPSGNWKWILDHGNAVKDPQAALEQPQVRRASCANVEPSVSVWSHKPDQGAFGSSPDQTLKWAWAFHGPDNSRYVIVTLWDGSDEVQVLRNAVPD